MSHFDSIYEKYIQMLKEDTKYINSTFIDNIALLVKVLSENDLLPTPLKDITGKEVNNTEYAQELMKQEKNTKEIILDQDDEMIPPVKLLLNQDSNSESFSITVVNVREPEKQKEFKNTMLETIFDDVVDYVKQLTIQGLSVSNQVVNKMPPEEGANVQLGSEGESALPGVDPQLGKQPSV